MFNYFRFPKYESKNIDEKGAKLKLKNGRKKFKLTKNMPRKETQNTASIFLLK